MSANFEANRRKMAMHLGQKKRQQRQKRVPRAFFEFPRLSSPSRMRACFEFPLPHIFISMSSFGQAFRVTTWGESHAKSVGCVIDGSFVRLCLRECVWVILRCPHGRLQNAASSNEQITRNKTTNRLPSRNRPDGG